MRTLPVPITTPRLVLRALAAGDGGPLAALVQANADRLADSFPRSVTEVVDEDDGEEYIATKVAEWREARGFWLGAWRDGALVGQVQLKNIDWSVGSGELAYWIDRAHEGQGLVSEALAALIAHAFGALALREVFLRAIAGNARSVATARRLGFVYEGTARGDYRTLAGAIVDVDYFVLTAP